MILVTGAGGFVGRHLLELAAGGELRALLRTPDPELEDAHPEVEFVYGDLLDPEALGRATRGARAVVHLASKTIDRDRSGFHRVNVEGTRRLAEAAIAGGARRLVYLSSAGVYGHRPHRNADEDTPVAPDTPLSRSRVAAERLLLDRHRAGELDCVVLRPRFVYGAGDRHLVPRILRAVRRYPFWIGGGRACLSLVWVGDLARSALRFARFDTEPPPAGVGPVYHVTDGEPVTYRDLTTRLCRLFDLTPPRWSLPYPLLYGALRLREKALGIDPEAAPGSLTSIRIRLVGAHSAFSNARLARALGSADWIGLDEGLRRSRAFYARYIP